MPKILIVEDNQENMDLLVYFLRPQGYELIMVHDGLEALKKVEEEKPDIILLDIMIPKLDGFQVCERLKKDDNTKFIPIIMITALKELKDKIRSLEAGADDFITKPFENVELLARVKSLLRLKEYHDEVESKNIELEEKNNSLIRMDQFKEDLVNLIVHDMKNPLFVIQGNLQMMSMHIGNLANENVNKYLSRIERSSHQLLRMVTNLLDITHIEDGSLKLKFETVDFNQILVDVFNRLKEYPENKNKELNAQLDDLVPELVLDKSIIERVVENLLNFATGNVLEGGKVDIQTQKIDDKTVEFSVHDNGNQLPKKFHDKIFEKFSQAEIKNDGYRVGRALGLTFCKMAVESHNGRMWLDLENPVGNRFVLQVSSQTAN